MRVNVRANCFMILKMQKQGSAMSGNPVRIFLFNCIYFNYSPESPPETSAQDHPENTFASACGDPPAVIPDGADPSAM